MHILRILFKRRKELIPLLLVVLLSLPSILPLLKKGFFVTDDGDWMIIRFSAFHQALRDGEFPVRFLGRLNHEYGYPVANFLYPGFMYLAEPFHLIGFDFIESVKIIITLSMIFSCIFTYLWLRKFFDTIASFLGALFYLYTPYHLYDLYQRGSVGEILALAVLPFILWQIERKSLLWSSLGIGMLLIAHNTLALVFLAIVIGYILLDNLKTKKKKFLINPFFPVMFGLGLAAFFWIPALYELPYTVFSQTTISTWKDYFASITLVGYATFAVFLLTLIIFIIKRIDIKKYSLTTMFFVIGVCSLFLAMPFSSWLWTVLPVSFVQFPFRFLSVTVISVSFLAAFNLSLLNGRLKWIVSTILICLLAYSAINYINPTIRPDKEEGYYATNMDTTTVHGEYMPIWVKENPTQKPEKKVIIKGKGEIKNLISTNKEVSFAIDVKSASTVQINTIYWPGWNAFVNGKIVKISYNNSMGLIEVPIDTGMHNVRITFGETPVRLFSDFVSVISLGSLVTLLVYRKNKHKK